MQDCDPTHCGASSHGIHGWRIGTWATPNARLGLPFGKIKPWALMMEEPGRVFPIQQKQRGRVHLPLCISHESHGRLFDSAQPFLYQR